MKLVLLHNPHAGNQDFTAHDLTRMLKRHGHQPVTLNRQQLNRFYRGDVSKLPGEMVVVVGGDGSVKRAALALAAKPFPLAIIPQGTANNIALSLGLEGSPEKIIRAWKTSDIQGVDLGLARGPWGERYFIESVGVGLIGRAIAILDKIGGLSGRTLDNREDRLFRDLCVMLALTHELQAVPLRLKFNAKASKARQFLLCEILNIRRSGPGVELSQSADAFDGFLDLVTVTADERQKLLKLLERCLAGKLQAPLLRTQRARYVHFSIGNHEIRIDDEVIWPNITPTGPRTLRPATTTIEVAPGALRCLLPHKNKNR